MHVGNVILSLRYSCFRKQAIHSEKTFDFLRDLVVNVPDHQAEDEGESVASGSVASSTSGTHEKKPKTIRYTLS